MRYISIDIETTGLDRENNQIIEIGAIIEDTNQQLPFDKIPIFHSIVRHDNYSGEAYVINLNKRIFEILSQRETIKNEDELVKYDSINNIESVNSISKSFYSWLFNNYRPAKFFGEKITIIAAGKNFDGFDKQFLQRLPQFNSFIGFDYRSSLDPAMLYLDFQLDDRLPNLKTCKERAGISGEITHNAVQDAWDVIQVLRKKY